MNESLSAREELHSIIEFRILPSITYHDVNQQIHSRKARVHREKSNEYLAGAGVATGASAFIGSNRKAYEAGMKGVSKVGEAVGSFAPKMGGMISRNSSRILVGGLAAAPLVLGGAALAHRIAGWTNDSRANKEQKLAQAVRMERFKKLQDSAPAGTKFSSRDELNLILFGGDPRPRNNLGMFSGGGEGGPNPQSMQITYQPQVVQQGAQQASMAGAPEVQQGQQPMPPQPQQQDPQQKPKKIVKR